MAARRRPWWLGILFVGLVLGSVVLFLIVPLLLRAFVIEAFKIPAGSMIPTLMVGDHLFVDKRAYTSASPRRGDVVVFAFPPDPTKDFVKRVVAVAGDTVEVQGGQLRIRDAQGRSVGPTRTVLQTEVHVTDSTEENRTDQRLRLVQERFADGPDYRVALRQDGEASPDFGPSTVAPGQLFMMGDNRDNSYDSRFWGPVPTDQVKGRATLIWFSRDRSRIGRAIH